MLNNIEKIHICKRTLKTLPEAQRTQGIQFITQIIFITQINFMSSYLKEKKSISFCLFVCLFVESLQRISFKYAFSDLLEISSKFGHWVMSLQVVPKKSWF